VSRLNISRWVLCVLGGPFQARTSGAPAAAVDRSGARLEVRGVVLPL